MEDHIALDFIFVRYNIPVIFGEARTVNKKKLQIQISTRYAAKSFRSTMVYGIRTKQCQGKTLQ